MLHDTESFLRVRSETISACDAEFELNFVVVDDSAGTDLDVVRLHQFDDVDVITPPFNLGHQGAIVYALRLLADRAADVDLVVTMDSDGEDQPVDVPRLLSALDDDGIVLALAKRTQRSESLTFRIMYVVYRLAFRALTGTTVRSGNFAAQRASSLAVTIRHPSFDLCYSSTLLALRRPTIMVPCARGERFDGVSRMSPHSLMAHGVRMLLPLSERIAIRAMLLSSGSASATVALLAVVALALPAGDAGRIVLVATATMALVALASLVVFVALFPEFAQRIWSNR